MNVVLFPGHFDRDETWAQTAEALFQLQQARKELERQEDLFIAALKSLSDGVNSKGSGYAYSRTERLGSVNYTKIEVLKLINLELYRKPTVEIWKLTKYE